MMTVNAMSYELYIFFAMFLSGVISSVCFDFLRAFRFVLKPPNVIVAVTDILFWIFIAFAISAVSWNFNNGGFRLYEPIGILLGATLYFLTVGRVILRLFLFIFENILKIIRFILKILLTPSQFLYKILVVPILFAVTNKKRKGNNSCDG